MKNVECKMKSIECDVKNEVRRKPILHSVFYILHLLVFLFSSAGLFAQNGTITGRIIDTKVNEPLIGAVINIEGTALGAAADFDGNFVIENVPAGTYTLIASYVAYEPARKPGVTVSSNQTTSVEMQMSSDAITLDAVVVVGRANRESENVLLVGQRESLVATQAVGARELSRKGIGDAQGAVAQVSGISRQEGAKNVFVRGLGDRYNMTLLNGFPIPSEDPEYKNIALEMFTTDVIANIGVRKVFNARDYADVGGAAIDISSKELVGNSALAFDVSGGINTAAIGTKDFLQQDGANYFGFAKTQRPHNNTFTFPNSLDPESVSSPVNYGFGVSGGKLFHIGENRNPLSFFVVASHNNDFSYTKEIIRTTTTTGDMRKDQTGHTYSQNTSQLVLADATYDINQKHRLQYNFMLIHATDQYVGEYKGLGADYEDSPRYNSGMLRRQQINDNLLVVNQLNSDWALTERLKFDAGLSYNSVKGNEPDRRVNNFSLQDRENNLYSITKSNSQLRFFSTLTDNDLNAKAGLAFKLIDRYGTNHSAIRIGYKGRFSGSDFEALDYTYSDVAGFYDIDHLKLDNLYNQTTQENGDFVLKTGRAATYSVNKQTHSGYVEASYQILRALSGNIGLRIDAVDMTVDYNIQTAGKGQVKMTESYLLPSLNLKYDLTKKNSLRLGASKTYTLPQSKEISPYQYVNISFVSQGNLNIKPSENYNVDLKWDYYISASELLSVNGFYKHILNPIGRVDRGNASGMLTYDNISNFATVGGVEVELRKNLFSRFNTEREQTSKLSLGMNASYIYTNLALEIRNTPVRNSELEGASPFLANADLTYNYTIKDRDLTAALVFNYFSDRIHTIGTRGFENIMEEGVPTLDFAASYKFNRHLSVKAKAGNVLNQAYRLTRRSSSGENIVLNEYKKGQNISIGIGYEF